MTKSPNPEQIAVVSLWAEDDVKTAHFYKDVIGLKIMPHHGGHSHFKIGDTVLVILKGKPHPATETTPERFPVIALATKDLDLAVSHLQAQNIELPWGIEEDTTARWVMFHDPAGNLIELVEFR